MGIAVMRLRLRWRVDDRYKNGMSFFFCSGLETRCFADEVCVTRYMWMRYGFDDMTTWEDHHDGEFNEDG
jgi:hypothetical protein